MMHIKNITSMDVCVCVPTLAYVAVLRILDIPELYRAAWSGARGGHACMCVVGFTAGDA